MLDKKTKIKMNICADITLVLLLIEATIGVFYILNNFAQKDFSLASVVSELCLAILIIIVIGVFILLLGTFIGSSFDKKMKKEREKTIKNNVFNFKESAEGIFIEPTNKTINVCEFSDKRNNSKIIVGTPGKGKMYTREEEL